VHRHGHRNGQQSGHIFASLFCLLSPWRPPEQYGASSHPMAAFNGFYENPGPPSPGNACGIAPSHRLALAIEVASNGGTFVCCCHLFRLIKM
jgi:hypothetical protein